MKKNMKNANMAGPNKNSHSIDILICRNNNSKRNRNVAVTMTELVKA
jgi:hypothetical protein